MSKGAILVVEDEAIVAEDLSDKVEQLGYEVAGICAKVQANQDQVIRILANLILNAVQAMPDGGEMEIRVSQDQGNRACVEVRDTGCGISAGNLPRIFDPLFTTKVKGIGLGLAVCQRYAQVNNAQIVAESVPGKGSTFRLMIEAVSA